LCTLYCLIYIFLAQTTAFNDTELAFLARFCIVQFDKVQNIKDMPDATQEDRFIAAARQAGFPQCSHTAALVWSPHVHWQTFNTHPSSDALYTPCYTLPTLSIFHPRTMRPTLHSTTHSSRPQVKAVNPRSVTLMYLNGLINFPAFQRLLNATVADPALLLRNSTGGLVYTGPWGELLTTFDVRNTKMRQVFVDDAVYGVRDRVVHGVTLPLRGSAHPPRTSARTRVYPYHMHTAHAGWPAPC